MIKNKESRSLSLKDDEIDVIAILAGMIKIIKQNLKLLFACIFLGTFLGLIQYYFTPRIYSTKLIAISNTLPNPEIINIVQSWQNMIYKSDFDALARELNMPVRSVENISKIKAENTGNPNPETGEDGSFTIAVEVLDNNILDSLQTSIVGSLQNNEFAKKRVELKKQNFESLKKKINTEIAELEEMKSSIKKLLEEGSTSKSNFLTDPANINLQLITLYERILNLNTSIELSDDIQIINGFTRFNRPDVPRMIIFLIGGVGLGLFIGFVIIGIKVINNKLKERATNPIYSK